MGVQKTNCVNSQCQPPDDLATYSISPTTYEKPPNTVCVASPCQSPDDLLTYSLDGGVKYANSELSFIWPNGAIYVVPPGTFSAYVPPNAGQGVSTPPVCIKSSCQPAVCVTIPDTASASEISALMATLLSEVAAQQSQCDYQAAYTPQFFSNSVSFTCPNNPAIQVTGGSLPPTVTYANWKLTLIAGVFSSLVSQANADAQAVNFLSGVASVLVSDGYAECGWVNTQQTVTCPDSSQQTIAAGTYFSSVSLAAANALAIAAATAACSPSYCMGNPTQISQLVWTVTSQSGDATVSGSGGIVNGVLNGTRDVGAMAKLTAPFCNISNSPLNVTFTFDGTITLCPFSEAANIVEAGLSGFATTIAEDVCATTNTPQTVSVPANSTVVFEIDFTAEPYEFSTGVSTINGNVTLST